MHFRIIFTILLSFSTLFCGLPASIFNAKKIYIADGFNNRTLSGSSIGLGPVLTKRGIDLFDSSDHAFIYKNLGHMRSDLFLLSFDQIKTQLELKMGKSKIDSLFLQLYNGDITRLQTNDSLWKYLSCDYFMSVRIKDAMSIKTFNNVHKKRIYLEAELWNRKDQEVVLRIEVNGSSEGDRYSDKQVIIKALEKVYKEIPETVPSYENARW